MAEDGGQALIAEFGDADRQGLFVRVQSWDESEAHDLMRLMIGRRVSITIEAVD
jgi:hypothetical protein